MSALLSQWKPPFLSPKALDKLVVCALAVLAAFICVEAVAWAFRPYFYICSDEIGNLVTRTLSGPRAYREILQLMPRALYNDRPVGLALEWLLFDWFGFEYSKQLVVFVSFHLCSCFMLFILARRLGTSVLAALAVVAAFGGSSVTAMTATYLGAVFDVLCSFFTFASFIAFLSRRRIWHLASAIFFLLALRSKEYAIVVPFLLAALFLIQSTGPLIGRAKEVCLRLWPHFLLTALIAVRYFKLQSRQPMDAASPYYMEFSGAGYLKSLLDYTGLAFGREAETTDRLLIFGILYLALLAYAWLARNRMSLFCLACYTAMLLPVCCLPHLLRAPYYVYGPQAFLWLAILLTLESGMLRICRPEYLRLATRLTILTIMLLLLDFRVSDYFRNRINYVKTVRTVNGVAARDLRDLGVVKAGSHIYLNTGKAVPYILSWNSGDYLRILNRRQDIVLVYEKPESELLQLYAADKADKVFWDYREDGSLRFRMRSARSTSRNP